VPKTLLPKFACKLVANRAGRQIAKRTSRGFPSEKAVLRTNSVNHATIQQLTPSNCRRLVWRTRERDSEDRRDRADPRHRSDVRTRRERSVGNNSPSAPIVWQQPPIFKTGASFRLGFTPPPHIYSLYPQSAIPSAHQRRESRSGPARQGGRQN